MGDILTCTPLCCRNGTFLTQLELASQKRTSFRSLQWRVEKTADLVVW